MKRFILTRMGSPFSEQSAIHRFLRALVIATYKNLSYSNCQ